MHNSQRFLVRSLFGGFFATLLLSHAAFSQTEDISEMSLNSTEMSLNSADGESAELDGDIEQDEFVTAGRLTRLRRGGSGSERFAVVSEEGEVLAFIAPTARINLRRHMNQDVRIVARTLTWEEGKAPYVMVRRLSPMQRSRIGRGRVSRSGFAGGQPGDPFAVRQAQHNEAVEDGWEVIPPGAEIVDGSQGGPIMEGPIINGPIMDGSIVHDGICDGCAQSSIPCECGSPCRTCCKTCRNGYCGPAGWLWLRGEYLAWGTKGMYLPPLVTTGTVNSSGILGEEGTEILLGNNDILDGTSSGYRIKFGGYWPPCRRWAWDGEYFELSEERFTFSSTGDPNGNPVIARPFFNINPTTAAGLPDPPAREDAELVSFPGLITGTVSVNAKSKLESAGGRLRWNLCCSSCGSCGGNCCGVDTNPRGHRRYSRIDIMFGYRYVKLDEMLTISEDLISISPDLPSAFEITDSFRTNNEFHGGDIGFMWLGGFNRLSLEALLKLGIGNVKQEAFIDGSTQITTLGAPPQQFDVGILAMESNIGTYSRDELAVVPEIGTTFGYYLTPRLRATVGYTFLYLSRVLRPGEIVDLDADPNGFGGEALAVQVPRPRFEFIDTDYWAHGLNVGLDLSW